MEHLHYEYIQSCPENHFQLQLEFARFLKSPMDHCQHSESRSAPTWGSLES